MNDEQARQEFEAVAREQWPDLDLEWRPRANEYGMFEAWLEATKRSAQKVDALQDELRLLDAELNGHTEYVEHHVASSEPGLRHICQEQVATITTLTTRNAALTEALRDIGNLHPRVGSRGEVHNAVVHGIIDAALANDPRRDCYGTELPPIAESDGALYAAKEPQP